MMANNMKLICAFFSPSLGLIDQAWGDARAKAAELKLLEAGNEVGSVALLT